MPEATPAAVAPTPSAHPNAPQNGAAPPAAGAATQTQPPAAGATDITAKYKQLETEHQKKVREHIVERRKWEGERKTLSERAAKAAELEKREQSARLNPPAFLKSIYGDDWHAVLTEAKVNGVPPAQLIEQEMQKMREEFAEKDRAREEAGSKAQESAKEQATEQARQSIFAESAAWYRSNAAEFPLLSKLGAEPAVARIMAQRIEHEFHQSGKILQTAEVAELIEGEVLEWAREAGKHEKYKAKLQPASSSSTVVPSKQQQGQPQQPAAPRRSLTNDITGSTSAKTAPASEKERRERSIAAYEAAKRKG